MRGSCFGVDYSYSDYTFGDDVEREKKATIGMTWWRMLDLSVMRMRA